MSEQGEAWPKGPAGPAEQPVVLEADIEAAEGHFARVARLYVVLGGALGIAALVVGLVKGGSAVVGLWALAALGVGAPVAAGLGWCLAGVMMRSIERRKGLLVGYAAQHGFRRRGALEKFRAAKRMCAWRPCPEDIPPGMSREEYVEAYRRGATAGYAMWFPGIILIIGWLMALGTGAQKLAIAQAAPTGWLVFAVFLLSVIVAGPGGWLVRWRSERDTVARWAGATTMDEFMRTRGWEWRWWRGWRRRLDPRGSPHGE